MKLRLLYTDSVPQSCPTVYETDRGTFVVQGDKLTDREARDGLANMLPDEDAVEVPRATLLGAARITQGRSKMVAPDSEEFDQTGPSWPDCPMLPRADMLAMIEGVFFLSNSR